MANREEGININIISGGIVNFGGAVKISPISITNTTPSSNSSNEELFEAARTADESAFSFPQAQEIGTVDEAGLNSPLDLGTGTADELA